MASRPTHWLAHPISKLPAVLSLRWLAGPAATLALGYRPGRRLGLRADLPAGVFWQWRRWRLRNRYSSSDWDARLSRPDLDKARFDLDLVAIADDWMIPPGVVWRLADFYPKALVKRTLVEPKAFGIDAIGHLAVFGDRHRAAWALIGVVAHAVTATVAACRSEPIRRSNGVRGALEIDISVRIERAGDEPRMDVGARRAARWRLLPQVSRERSTPLFVARVPSRRCRSRGEE